MTASLARELLDAHLAAHPEEASTLGVREHDARLNDPSRRAAESELVQLRAVLRDTQVLAAPTSEEARLDRDAVVRSASFHVRRIEQDSDAENLELAALPSAALQHSALHARSEDHWNALASRAHAVPAFLGAHAENLRRGVRDGRAPDDAVARTFADRILPASAESIRQLAAVAAGRGVSPEIVERIDEGARAASDAYLSFQRFVEKIIVPATRTDVRLGEPEVAWRLRETMGIDRSIAELLTLAREALVTARLRIEEQAAAMGAEPRQAIRETLARRPATVDDALALYRGHIEAASRFVVDHALVRLPEPLALELAPLPAGIADGSPVTNWPAPLLDPEGRGHILVDVAHVAPHALVATKNLAVHEGIPGHYLQSVAWQRAARTHAHAVRFIGVSDHVAMSRAYFGAMVSVEGWAVYMEQLMFEHGFYDRGAETLFFAVCDAIRAARVVLDLELHAGDVTPAAAALFLSDATLLPESWANWQVLRAKRMPLQGLTYLVGAHEHADLRARRPRGEALPAFHQRLLDAGPVPLSRLLS